jgi:signal transduction histidine kinase
MASDPKTPIPLLVVRLRDLERIAWREGRAAARTLERRSLRSFVETASRALRASDILAHDDDSEDFLAALVSPTRTTGAVATPTDCRATLARLASAMELGGGMHVETGWTILYGLSGEESLKTAVANALERGSRERERFDFFSTIGHELRTPLTSIRGYLETLLEQDLDPATTRRFLEVARAEAVRLGRLVDGMFELSMLDLRVGSHHGESCRLAACLAAAFNAVAPFAVARRTTMPAPVYEDREVAVAFDRLVQIFVNVLENAIKHGREGGRVAVSVAAVDPRYVEVCVDDDGPGVEPHERESIFSLASRGSNAKAKGWGIGLAVVRLMLERIGGEVDVAASELGGARFSVRVPVMLPSAEGNGAAAFSR